VPNRKQLNAYAIYYRYLRFLQWCRQAYFLHTELSEAVKVDSATIRRDFSYFGGFKEKADNGYDVEESNELFL